MKNINIEGLFNNMWVFGDSLSDYGSTSAYAIYQTDWTKPYWSGTTFSNEDYNWQIGLRERLGLELTREDFMFMPDAYAIYNEFAAYTGTEDGPSFAVGGASTGTENLFQIPGITRNTGIALQVKSALDNKAVQFDPKDLVVLWGGANDVFMGVENNKPLEPLLDTILLNQEDNLKRLISLGGAKNVLVVPISAVEGNLAGAEYKVTFLSKAEEDGTLPEGWEEQLNAGAVEQFYNDFQSMVEKVDAQYPATNVMFFNPDYDDIYEEFGNDFGTFKDYGITNTIDHVNENSKYDGLSNKSPIINTFLYFDSTGHVTKSGHQMWEQAIALTLEKYKDEIINAQNIPFPNNLPPFNFTGQANSPLKLVEHQAVTEILVEEDGSFYFVFEPHAINNAIVNGVDLEAASDTISAIAALYTDDGEADVSDDLITAETALDLHNGSRETHLLALMETITIENNGELIDLKEIIQESLANNEAQLFKLPGSENEGVMVKYGDVNESPFAGSVLVNSEGEVKSNVTIDLGVVDLDQDFETTEDQAIGILVKDTQDGIASEDKVLLKLDNLPIAESLEGGEKAEFVYAAGHAVTEETTPIETIFGTPETDVIQVPNSPAQQLVFAGDGDDFVDTSSANAALQNVIYGGLGNDIITAGSKDILMGNEGDDAFYITSGGDNILTGGSGADQFWLATAEYPAAMNQITDFEVGVDVLGIGGLGLEFADLTLTQADNNTIVAIASNGLELASLVGINPEQLSVDNFVFV